MKIVTSILPLVLAGSVALAGTAPKQSAPKTTSQHKAAPLATPTSSTTPAATMAPASDKAPATGKAPDAKAPMMTKISKEQAGTIALGTMKGAQVVSSELKEMSGKQVWAVTLKEGEKKHQVMVDATEGTVMKNDTKHTKHHKEGAAPEKH